MRNFDTIPRLVRTVDGEILSEIAIHNFEKNRKIETRILPYGRKKDEKCYRTLYLKGLKRSR